MKSTLAKITPAIVEEGMVVRSRNNWDASLLLPDQKTSLAVGTVNGKFNTAKRRMVLDTISGEGEEIVIRTAKPVGHYDISLNGEIAVSISKFIPIASVHAIRLKFLKKIAARQPSADVKFKIGE